jgi:serine/threonine-protein kinase RsbW
VGEVIGAIMQAIADHGFDPCTCFGIRLALAEALANAIHHGNRCDPDRHVTIVPRITDEQVSITITDEGPGFSCACVPDPTADENIERPSGRGVMLMRAYMDKVIFNKRGNQVKLIKKRGSVPGACTAGPPATCPGADAAAPKHARASHP